MRISSQLTTPNLQVTNHVVRKRWSILICLFGFHSSVALQVLTIDHSRTFWHILLTSAVSAYVAPTKDPMLVPPTMSIGIPTRKAYMTEIHLMSTPDSEYLGIATVCDLRVQSPRTYAERKLKQLRKGCTTFFRWFNPFILLHQYASSPYCSLYISLGVDKENCLTIKSLLKCLSFPLFS